MTPKKVNGKLPLFSGNGSRVIPIYVLKYKPTHRKYACDANMVPATHKNQVSIEKIKYGAWRKRGRPFAEEFQLSNFAKNQRSQVSLRFQFTSVWEYHTAIHAYQFCRKENKHGTSCKVCGDVDYSRCSICGIYRNFMANRDQAAGRTCFFH